MERLTRFRGSVRASERFAVEYVGHYKLRIDRFQVPGPYALFCGNGDRWRYMNSCDGIYNLVAQAKVYEREFNLPTRKVLISTGCDYILDFEIQHFQRLRKQQSDALT